MDNRESSGSGTSFAALLTIVFITLKLTGVIDWHWLWVLSPLWIGLGLFLIGVLAVLACVCAVVGIPAGIVAVIFWLENKKEKRNDN